MKIFLIKCANGGMSFLYFFMKLFPTQNKVTFISRQGNQNSLDFALVQKRLKEENPNIRIVVLNRRFRDTDSIFQKFKYCFHILTQMRHIATSKVVVLETYCMPISMLKHKKELKVIQMWHALGSLKKFGYSVIDKKEGSDLSEVAKMHKNYDIILTSSEASKKHFAEAFGYKEEYLKVLPLPRVDYALDLKNQKRIQKEIKASYPILNKKKNIVYAPTFRKNGDDILPIQKLVEKIDYTKYNLILKLHPLTKLNLENTNAISDTKYATLDWLMVADYVITDYSAIVYEAAILHKPIFLYTHDFHEYETGRDFYLNYKKEMPGFISKDPKKIVEAIEKGNYDLEKVKAFADKYVEHSGKDCTLELVNLILK